jgi:putative transposase
LNWPGSRAALSNTGRRQHHAPDRHAALKEMIKAIFDSHKGRYGYRRVTAQLRVLGQRVNHKTVQILMAGMG